MSSLFPACRLAGMASLACLATLGALLTGSAFAHEGDLIAYEGFDYNTGSSLEFLNGGTGWKAAWTWRVNVTGGSSAAVMNAAIIQPGSLAYGSLHTKGNHVHLTGELGELQLARVLATPFAGEAGTSTYISFIGQRVGPLDDPNDNAGTTTVGDKDSWYPNPYPRGASVRFWNQTSERLSIGNFSNWKTNEWSTYGSSLDATSGVAFDTLSLVVVRIDHVGDATVADNLYMWVNPDLAAGENLSTAQIRKVPAMNGSTPVDFNGINWISPYTGHASLTASNAVVRPHAEFLLDELRIGKTWDAVTPYGGTWAGFNVDAHGWANTGAFLGWVYPWGNDWVYSQSLDTWLYLPESWVGESGAWVYFHDDNLNPPQQAVEMWAGFPVVDHNIYTGHLLGVLWNGQAPWLWSYGLGTWLYLTEDRVADGFALAWVNSSNPPSTPLPEAPVVPIPSHEDWHVDTDTGVVTLRWSLGQNAASNDIYFGTDPEAVAAATHDSPEFMGNQEATSLEIQTAFNPLKHYYWRVDSVNSRGTTPGDVWQFKPRRLAFPGAEGYGRYAVGGTFGQVVAVTNLNDSGPGSLRWAIEEVEGPRTIVFNVCGVITLESHLTVQDNDSQITIAGQTAPGKGITLRKHKLGFSGVDDSVMRYLRSRIGNIADLTSDGTGMQGSNHSIFDHISVSWSIDEAFSSRSGKNITLQRTILAEALNEAGHKNYPEGTRHGYAASIGGDVGSFHHNLLAHCSGRNWSMAGGLIAGAYAGRLDLRNNVVYNWATRTTDGGAMEVNFVGNYYKQGPATSYLRFLNPQHEGAGTGSQRYYMAGNILDFTDPKKTDIGPVDQTGGYTTDSSYPDAYVDTPFFPSHTTEDSAQLAYKKVLSDVGCNLPTQDNMDHRIVGETLARSYTYTGSKSGIKGLVDTQDDSGGWEFYDELQRPANWDADGDGLPGWWEAMIGTSDASPTGDLTDTQADPDGDFWTNLDEYLHFMATPHYTCAPDATLEVDLSQFTRGFTDGPAHTVIAVSNGSAEILADGQTLRFTPGTVSPAIAWVRFRVTDAAGDTMDREVAIYLGAPFTWEEPYTLVAD